MRCDQGLWRPNGFALWKHFIQLPVAIRTFSVKHTVRPLSSSRTMVFYCPCRFCTCESIGPLDMGVLG